MSASAIAKVLEEKTMISLVPGGGEREREKRE